MTWSQLVRRDEAPGLGMALLLARQPLEKANSRLLPPKPRAPLRSEYPGSGDWLLTV